MVPEQSSETITILKWLGSKQHRNLKKCEINTTFLDVLEQWQHRSIVLVLGTAEAVLHRRWCWDGCIHIYISLELAVSIWNWGGRRRMVMKMPEEPKNRSDL